MHPSIRSLALAGSAGFGLSLLSALPASAHGLAGAGLMAGAFHPLSGIDHLLLLVGVGAVAARLHRRLLWPALFGALLGAVFGSAGASLPAAEPLAALSISVLGVLLLLAARLRQASAPLAFSGGAVAVAVALHALLHGLEASADPSWWLGAAISAVTVIALSYATLRRSGSQLSRAVAVVLGISGLLLAFVPAA